MKRILLINPNKWGRGITHIWIASHSALLKNSGCDVRLFDATFYKNWTKNEVEFNTKNEMYKPTQYDSYIKFNSNDIISDLQEFINSYKPDIIFGSAISSHIHAEGEYSNIFNYNNLISKVKTDALIIAGGLQPTALPEEMFNKYNSINVFIMGESEFVLNKIATNNIKDIYDTQGIIYKKKNRLIKNPRQPIITNLDSLPLYDYKIFDDQVFYRPYNGKVVKAIDYEMSRGCIYTCSYCVETVIQKYYGFNEASSNGVLLDAGKYLRNKSSQRIFDEIKTLNSDLGIQLFRCQDTNFLSIEKKTLLGLADLIESSNIDFKLYIETRPDGINEKTVKLLKRLNVDGVGMGIEVSAQDFREEKLNRYASREKILRAFHLLNKAKIKSTAYNIIGIPGENEAMIINTIEFNRELDPDNLTVAYFSPYAGTLQQEKAYDEKSFDKNEFDLDSSYKTLTQSQDMTVEKLNFYKRNFTKLVKEGLKDLDKIKKESNVL